VDDWMLQFAAAAQGSDHITFPGHSFFLLPCSCPDVAVAIFFGISLVLPCLYKSFEVAINTEEKADSSGLLSGSIQVDQGIHQLSKGSGFSLGGLQNAILEIKPQNGGFDLVLRGKAGHLRTAYLGQKSNLMPTWLQYFRQNQAFLFYFSSLCALFTVLFPLRNWFLKPRN
jgi:hypothetical protein